MDGKGSIVAMIFDNKGREEKRDVDGEKAYQVGDGVPHPAFGYPCRAEMVNG